MQELIDREVTLQLLDKSIELVDGNSIQDRMTKNGLLVAKRIVSKQPTIEAEPVRHGHWETCGYVFHGIEWKRCSRCGKCADVSYYGLLDGIIRLSTPAICGGCGARMDGGTDNG